MSQGYKLILDESPELTVSRSVFLPGIDSVHQRVHNGEYWSAAQVRASTAGAYYWHVRTPNTITQHHLQVDFSADNTGAISMYKSPVTHSITTGQTGTALTPINHNLADTAHTTTMQIFAGTLYDSSLTVANIMETAQLGTNRPGFTIGGSANSRDEWILAGNSNYTIKWLTSAASVTTHFNAKWYTVG